MISKRDACVLTLMKRDIQEVYNTDIPPLTLIHPTSNYHSTFHIVDTSHIIQPAVDLLLLPL